MRAPSAARRQDIQGLRALGALLVVGSHLWWSGILGALDVFFVVSGFFLGVGLVQRHDAVGSSAIARHLLGFLTRIAPQAIVALLGILIIAFWFISPARWVTLLRDFAASALYVGNWWEMRQGTNYLARDADLSPTQHFWAAALIAQVYLLWAAVAMAPAWLARRRGWPVLPVAAGVLLALVVASFVWSVIDTARSPASAYFSLFARFWEFGAGALLALIPRLDLTRAIARTISWLGLVLLLTCGVAVGRTLPFPGYVALWPVAAALCILIAGDERDRWNAGSLLASRWLAGLGSLAFGIYLWHWPLVVVAAEAIGGWPIPLGLGLLIIAASIMLAAGGRWIAGRALAATERGMGELRAAAAFACALVTLAGLAAATERVIVWHGTALDHVAALTGRPGIRNGAFTASLDLPDNYARGCHQTIRDPRLLFCVDGSVGEPAIVVVGGSHAAHWLPALQLIGRENGFRIISMIKSACTFADPLDEALFRREHPSCAEWNRAAMIEILRLRPAAVVAIGTRRDGMPAGFVAAFERLQEAAIPVMAIRDTPWHRRNIPSCVFSPWTRDPAACGSERATVLDDAAYAAVAMSAPSGTTLVDMSDTVCDAKACPPVRDGFLIYRDAHHLTATYARELAPVLWQRMRVALRGPNLNQQVSR